MSRLRTPSVAATLSLLAAGAVLLAVWLPHFAHYYLPNVSIPVTDIERARRIPEDSILRELESLTPGFFVAQTVFDLRDPVPAADRLLQGDVEIPARPRTRITIPFSAADIAKGTGEWQLVLASLTLPELLLRAYERTGEDRYLFGARDMIVAWARYERQAWLPRGFLWNDHAVAARIPVLAAFWLAYREHRAYDPAVAATILQFAARSASFLARPEHFTVATNHGVMQNLALWHFALAFPTLPGANRYKQAALNRFSDQMRFYVNDEGVVLEHSAGYHRAGLQLVGLALRYLTLLGLPTAPAWIAKYQRALAVYTQLRLPDGALPTIGDTHGGADPRGPLTARVGPDGHSEPVAYQSTWPAPAPYALYPVAGYSVWWQGLAHWPDPTRLSQTVVAWSYFPGHGHKHADEMSVVLWGGGRTWLSNVGYWPDELSHRAEAESWSGSNAPHLADEPAQSSRSTRLLSSGWSEDLAALDLERRLESGYVARRQVIQVTLGVWVIVDHTWGASTGLTRTQWTTAPDVTVRLAAAPGVYRLQPQGGPLSMSLSIASSSRTTIRRLRGSTEPFGGWQVVNTTPTPADAIVLDQPGQDSWTITVWCLEDARPRVICPDEPGPAAFSSDEDWTITLPRRPTPLKIWRSAGVVRADLDKGSVPAALALAPPPGIDAARTGIRAAYENAVKSYPGFRDLTRYRLRVTYLLLGVLGLQELFFALPRPLGSRRSTLRVLAVAAWLGAGLWLTVVYLR